MRVRGGDVVLQNTCPHYFHPQNSYPGTSRSHQQAPRPTLPHWAAGFVWKFYIKSNLRSALDDALGLPHATARPSSPNPPST